MADVRPGLDGQPGRNGSLVSGLVLVKGKFRMADQDVIPILQADRPSEALELLRNALDLDPKLRMLAKAEEDFKSIRALPEFQKLIT